MAKETGQQGLRRTGTFHENELKICDLCGSLNLVTNNDCFVCGWTGRFERNQDVVHTAHEIAIQLHGRLELQDLTDIRTYRDNAPNLPARIFGWLGRLWQWLTG